MFKSAPRWHDMVDFCCNLAHFPTVLGSETLHPSLCIQVSCPRSHRALSVHLFYQIISDDDRQTGKDRSRGKHRRGRQTEPL